MILIPLLLLTERTKEYYSYIQILKIFAFIFVDDNYIIINPPPSPALPVQVAGSTFDSVAKNETKGIFCMLNNTKIYDKTSHMVGYTWVQTT